VKNIHYGDIHTKFKAQFFIGDEEVPFVDPAIDLSRVRESQYLQEGDLVIADASEDYADIGKSIEVVNLSGARAVAGLHTILARRKNADELATGFAAYLMQSEDMRLNIKRVAQGTKVLGLAPTRLGEIKMRLPHFEEQKKIADCLSALDRKIYLVEAQVLRTREFKRGLLQKMFV
jgi:type I restriction enzyme S subunit